MTFRTNDPIADYNGYCHYLQEEEERREILDVCAECGEPIREGDDYYEVDGKRYCESCIDDMRRLA